MKTKDELNALKEEVEVLNRKLAELSEDELMQVVGGIMETTTEEGRVMWTELLDKIERLLSMETTGRLGDSLWEGRVNALDSALAQCRIACEQGLPIFSAAPLLSFALQPFAADAPDVYQEVMSELDSLLS